jgi:hypothetical protein
LKSFQRPLQWKMKNISWKISVCDTHHKKAT